MAKSIKRNVIVSALLAICLCVSLIAGATFAIFTSESKVNIAVTSGKVEVTATVDNLQLYSLENIDLGTLSGTEKERTEEGSFLNGGLATLSGDTLTLDRLTPGDRVTFDINVANGSNVAIKYRTRLSVKDSGLFEALNVSIGGKTCGSVSEWSNKNAGEGMTSEQCSIDLPVSATNKYQGKSCEITFAVEAVQGNVDENTISLNDVYDEKQLRSALYNAPADGTLKTIKLQSDITLQMLYAAENFGIETIADNAEGDTFNRYKLGVHPSESDPSHWNSLVTDQTQEERVVYGAYYHMSATDERIARLVVKAGQNVLIDLNGYTLRKASRASHGDWSNTCTDIIGNYGTLTLTDSSEVAGTLMGQGYISCGGAVVHNYEDAICNIEKINVNGNAAGFAARTGQYVLSNEGNTMVVDSANVYDDTCDNDNAASLIHNTNGTITVKGSSVLTHLYTKTVNCKGGEVILEDGVKIVSDKYAVYAKGGTVTVKDITIVGTGILVENGGTIVSEKYAPVAGLVEIKAGDEAAVNEEVKNALAGTKTTDVADGKANMIVLPANTTATIESGATKVEQGKTKDIIITGSKDSVVKFVNSAPGSEGSLSYQDGANLTFKGITIDASEISGICARGGVVTFDGCTFNAELKKTIGNKFVFTNCEFNKPVSQVGYGCKDVVFEDCVFNTNGYGIKIYSEGNTPVNLTVKNCKFVNTTGLAKSAIFLDHIVDGISYNIAVDTCTFEGFTATPVPNENKWAARMIVAESFVQSEDGQYIFSYQTGAEGGNYHKILTAEQLVVTVK